MAPSQEAAVQIIQALRAGYADSYSAVGQTVDAASIALTGQPSASSRQLAQLNVQAAATAAAGSVAPVTVGALALMAPVIPGSTSAAGTVASNVGYLSGAVTSLGVLSSSAPVAGIVAGGVALVAALPTAASLLGRALLSGSASVGGAVPYRSSALPGTGMASGETSYQINADGTAAAAGRPIGVAYGSTATGAAGQNQNATLNQTGSVPPGTLLPDGTIAGAGGAPGSTSGLPGTPGPDGSLPGSPKVSVPGAGTSLPAGTSMPGGTGLPGGTTGLGGLGGGSAGLGGIGGGLGAAAARTVSFGDMSSMASSSAAAVGAQVGAVSSATGAGMNGMMPMMPMGGGAGGGGGEGGNRRVPTWLVETEDVWGEASAVAPGVIGETR